MSWTCQSKRPAWPELWRPSFPEQSNRPHTLLIGAGNTCDSVVGLWRAPVKSDLDRERPPFGQMIGDVGREKRAVGEERDDQSLLLGVRINLQEIRPRESLSPRIQKPQTAGLGDLVQDSAVFVESELPRPRLRIVHREIVIAMHTAQRTTAGQLDGPTCGNSPAGALLMKSPTEIAVREVVHLLLVLREVTELRPSSYRGPRIAKDISGEATATDSSIAPRSGQGPRRSCRHSTGHTRTRNPIPVRRDPRNPFPFGGLLHRGSILDCC